MNRKTKKSQNILNFPVAAPFDIVYRNSRTDRPVGPHSHNAVELYFTLSNLPDVLLNDIVTAVPSNTLIIIPPFCVHQLYHEADVLYERYILSINTQWLDDVFCNKAESFSYLKEHNKPLCLTFTPTLMNTFIQTMNKLLTFSSFTTAQAYACFFDLLSILNEIVTELSPKSHSPMPVSATQKNINQMITYIQDHIYENLTVAELAAHFYLHPDYLSRLFKKHAHISVSQYITVQKIATAQSLLREGLTVSQVQEKLGYSSYAYFFKSFQKHTGLSPSKYREQYLGLYQKILSGS